MAESLPMAQGRRPQNDNLGRTVSVKNFKSNDLENQFKDFDELQSLQSRDMISQLDRQESMPSLYHNNSVGKQSSSQINDRSDTPRGRMRRDSSASKVHKETPIIDKKNHDYVSMKSESRGASRRSSNVSLGSE